MPAPSLTLLFFKSDAGDTFLRLLVLYGAIFTVNGASGRAGERPEVGSDPRSHQVVYTRTRVNQSVCQRARAVVMAYAAQVEHLAA